MSDWRDVLKADDDIVKIRAGRFGTRNIRDFGRRIVGGSQEERQERAEQKQAEASIKRYFKQYLLPTLKEIVSQERTGQRLPIVLVFDEYGNAKIEGDKIVVPMSLVDAGIEKEYEIDIVHMTKELFKKRGFNVTEDTLNGKRAVVLTQ